MALSRGRICSGKLFSSRLFNWVPAFAYRTDTVNSEILTNLSNATHRNINALRSLSFSLMVNARDSVINANPLRSIDAGRKTK